MSDKPELQTIANLVATEFGFEEAKFCGKGASKETYRAKRPNGTLVALKLVDRTKMDIERTEREIDALGRCVSNRIARIIETRTFKSPDNRVFDIVLEEFFDGGSLESRLAHRRLTQQQVVELGTGLFLAVKDLHPLKLVHRDIKPANIMFRQNDPAPVLVDFGLVRDLSQTSLTESWFPSGPCTPFYASPEQLNNEKALIDWRSDQFSIGIIMGHLLTDLHPYQTDANKPSSAVYAALQRIGPDKNFRKTMNECGLAAVNQMVSPWPVQRFAEPNAVLAALKP
jgi:serine/threonine protein kinase